MSGWQYSPFYIRLPKMSMTSDQIISSIFDPITANVWEFVSSDLMLVVSTILGLLLVIVGVSVISKFLNMSDSEKGARSAFTDMKAHRGSFDAPIYNRKYKEALREYELGEDEDEDEDYSLDDMFKDEKA